MVEIIGSSRFSMHIIWVADEISSQFHCNWYPDVGLSSAKSVASLLVLVRTLTQQVGFLKKAGK